MDRRKTKRWEFLWWKEEEYYDTTKDHDESMRIKVYVAPTIKAACDKMVRFIQSQSFNVKVDYEACALHAGKYDPKQHEQTFPNLSRMRDHEIAEYIA